MSNNMEVLKMGWWPTFFHGEFKTVKEVEAAAFRMFYSGLIVLIAGLILTLTLVFRPFGVALMILGGLIMAVDIFCFGCVSKRNSINIQCPACQKDNQVFPGDTYFNCIYCGKIVLLRE